MLVISAPLIGCPAPPSTTPVFPADYASSFVETRDCRRSPDHDLAFIRVLASPGAAEVYSTRVGTFDEGAVVLKEEFSDPECADLLGWTAMRRESGGWRWQEVDRDRTVVEDGAVERCASCHAACGLAPLGFEGTCAEP